MRADAARNRVKVLQAADALFAAKGTDAGVPDIAARAGVGKGTVYRSFPSKEHLIAAVAIGRLEAWTERAVAAARADDPFAALRQLLRESARKQVDDRVLGETLTAAAHVPELQAARDAAVDAFDRLVTAAREKSDDVRDDVSGEQVRVLYHGVCKALAEREEHDPDVWASYADLVVDAVRATNGRASAPGG